jgi:hypothetical protein
MKSVLVATTLSVRCWATPFSTTKTRVTPPFSSKASLGVSGTPLYSRMRISPRANSPVLSGRSLGLARLTRMRRLRAWSATAGLIASTAGVEGAVREGVHAHRDGHADAHLAQQHFGQRALEVEPIERHDSRYRRARARHDADIHEPLGDHTIKGRADDRVRELLAQQREVRLRLLQRGACGLPHGALRVRPAPCPASPDGTLPPLGARLARLPRSPLGADPRARGSAPLPPGAVAPAPLRTLCAPNRAAA